MRVATFLAVIAALWVTPAHATAIWTFNVSAYATGTSMFYPDPTPIPTDKSLNFQVDLPSFATSSNLSARTGCAICDPTGLGGRTPGILGAITLSGGYLLGTNFLYAGGPAEFEPHTGANYQLTAPTFLITFVRSSDGTAPLPEPSTWMLMLLGFAALAQIMRRGHPGIAQFRLSW